MTNTQAVIVALPPVMDPIRLVGDEDKHATLLYFGETATLPDGAKDVLLNTVAQAAKLFDKFSEEIINIARLGSEDPPALVAMLSGYNLGKLREVLKMDSQVSGYLSNGDQHPTFTPHVTLGYPDYQGEAQLRDLMRSLYKVRFDRLALWWNDEQVEFGLGSSLDYAVEHGEDAVEKVLAHHGVKGMHWGVRKDKAGPVGSTRRGLGFHRNKPPATEDAKTAAASKKTIKKGGVQALSNKELQTLVTRMNLEQQYSKLSSQKSKKSKGSKFAAGLLADIGKDVASEILKEQARNFTTGRANEGKYHASQVTVNQLGQALKQLH